MIWRLEWLLFIYVEKQKKYIKSISVYASDPLIDRVTYSIFGENVIFQTTKMKYDGHLVEISHGPCMDTIGKQI